MKQLSWPGWAANVFNVIGFQIVWLTCVWGAARGTWPIGLYAAIAFAIAYFWLSAQRRRDALTLLIALPIGFLMDSLLAKSGLLEFAGAYPSAHWAPLWIMALWLGFAMTLIHSLQLIYQNSRRTFLFGFFGGPLAYAIASLRFDAMHLKTEPLIGLLAVALVWGFGLTLIRELDFCLRAHRSSAT